MIAQLSQLLSSFVAIYERGLPLVGGAKCSCARLKSAPVSNHTHTQTQLFNCPLFGTTRMSCGLVPEETFTRSHPSWSSDRCVSHIHLSDHSQLCSLKCRLVFFPYRPGLTSMQHTASHTATVQLSSHNQWYVLIGKQYYQLPEFIPSISNSGLHSCISIHFHPHSACHLSSKTYPLTPALHWHQCPDWLPDFSNLYFRHILLHFFVYPLLTASTLYWITTSTFNNQLDYLF